MAATQADTFDQLAAELSRGGVPALLDRLIADLRARNQYHELFEALKMRVRSRAGLPVVQGTAVEELDDRQRQQVEEGLIEACREVGMALLREGNLREGWMYMRPVGDRPAVAGELANVPLNEENIEEFIEVALHEGVDVPRGFAALVEHYGTCNAITTFEAHLGQRSRSDQQAAATILVRHIHAELLATLTADIAQQEGCDPPEKTLKGLVENRDWLFTNSSYHIDTTHLAASVRFARILENPADLRLALDLTEYGRRLHPQFQYKGEEPFVDLYPTHALFFCALLGERGDEALAHFAERARGVDVGEQGTAAAEMYVSLLARLGRHGEAIEASLELIPAGVPTYGWAPSLLELSAAAGRYDRLLAHCRQRQDLLGFAATLVRQVDGGKSGGK
jgi:hypothetical protein